jgi:hypothetical protein
MTYCPEGADEVFGQPLGCDVDLLMGAGLVAVPDGYGPRPSVLDWCLDPAPHDSLRQTPAR